MIIALLIAYTILLIWAGFSREKQTKEDFYLNKRSSSALEVGLSIVVSSVGASATIGMIGMAFTVGTPAFWWLGAGCFGLSVLSVLLAKKVRKTNAYTLPHLVEKLLGREARFLIALIIVIAWIAILAAQFSAIINLFKSLLGIDIYLSLLLGFMLIVLHSMGGQKAIMKLDRIQAVIIVISLFLLLIWLSYINPNWFDNTKIEATNANFSVSQLIYYFLIVGANYLVCPTLFSRLLSAKDEKTAKNGALIGVLGLCISACLIVSIGLAGKGLILANTSQDLVFTTILSNAVPSWLFILGSFALLAAIISSADTCLVVASTVLSFDILHKSSPKTARKCTLFIGLSGALLTLWGKGILGFLLMAYDVFACGVVMPVFVAILMHSQRQIQNKFACIAIISGGIIGTYGAIVGNTNYSYLAMALATIITFVGFAITTKLKIQS